MLRTAILGAMAVAVTAPAAHAATVYWAYEFRGNVLEFKAAPGERNNVTITQGSGGGDRDRHGRHARQRGGGPARALPPLGRTTPLASLRHYLVPTASDGGDVLTLSNTYVGGTVSGC